MHPIHSKILSSDLNLLITLHALIETTSVSKAADRIGRSQSAVSHALNRLREEFEDPLLLRKGRAMCLTPLAQDLKPDLRTMVDQLTHIMDRQAQFDPMTSTRPVRVACRDIALPLLTPLFARLAQEAPRMPIDLIDSPSALDAVRYGEADLGLVFSRPQSTRDLVVVELGRLDWATFGPAGHPFLQSGQREDWLDARHVVVSSAGEDEGPVETLLTQMGLTRTIAIRVGSFSAAPPLLSEMNALFSTLRAPVSPLADKLGLAWKPTPLDLPAPQARLVTSTRSDAFSEFLVRTVRRSIQTGET